ncbi:CubicO group peptidase (beta-lactamase class C family) [Salinibacterium amurskyense]|uniref:CubicO group peptidase (Beta-lactamase class C family) n=1 Tax=Salinibacterium amurskyense TaxID=205941 RepID=A0A2M9D6H0_9MICO|nr:serine hydrolase domain-containing protein [Salinibacterium amurskyense]PJJ81312.1 CubicO group peptidase (beta-lactamase class C family) [Salinibacterium amurskyense]RLQ83320.1 class A beta-lactamase-related serine hydrolase [Salinibacterium amurskyense]GHD80935.1 serine hydrolase [Salinibacterium amurskyense]
MDTTGLDEFLEQNDFSGTVLIKRGNATIYEAVAGKASQRWDVPNTAETRFDSSSITKLFTSVAALQQVSKNDLDLETSIHHYVDLADTEIDPAVTLLHVLTHTSGIADDVDEEEGESYADLWAEFPTYTILEPADQLPTFVNKEPLAEPGVECVYTNAGYVLAGLALEKVTKTDYRQYIFDEVFTPAGMIDSGFYDRRDAAPRVAEGWDYIDGRWVSNIYSAPPIGLPDGGAHVTAADLVRFIQAVRNGELLDTEFTEEFLTPQVQYDDETWYGFGLEFDMNEDGSVRSYFADGVSPGASGIVRHYLENGLDVVVLSNSEEGAWPVIREIDERLGG